MHTFYQLRLQQQLCRPLLIPLVSFIDSIIKRDQAFALNLASPSAPSLGLAPQPAPPSASGPAPLFTQAFSNPPRLEASRLSSHPICNLVRNTSSLFAANHPESSFRYRTERGPCQISSPPPNPPPRQPGAEPRSRRLPHSLDGDELLRLPHHSSSSGSGRAYFETRASASDEIVGHPAKRYFCLKLPALSTLRKIRT